MLLPPSRAQHLGASQGQDPHASRGQTSQGLTGLTEVPRSVGRVRHSVGRVRRSVGRVWRNAELPISEGRFAE